MCVSFDSLLPRFQISPPRTNPSPDWGTTSVHSSNAIVRNLQREEEETFRPPREEEQEDPPFREPTPAPGVVTLVGDHVVRRLQPGRTTDQDRHRPVDDEAGSASTAGDVTVIATEVLTTATPTVGRMTTTTLEIGAIEEDDAIRETGTETGVGVGVRLVIGEDTTTTVAELTRGGGNRRLELLTIAGEAGRGVLLLFLLLMRDGEATTAIAMSPDAEEAAGAATVTVTGEGETIDQPNERGTISVAGSIDSRLQQVRLSCNCAHSCRVAPCDLQIFFVKRERERERERARCGNSGRRCRRQLRNSGGGRAGTPLSKNLRLDGRIGVLLLLCKVTE